MPDMQWWEWFMILAGAATLLLKGLCRYELRKQGRSPREWKRGPHT
jgi:hypothetical protein